MNPKEEEMNLQEEKVNLQEEKSTLQPGFSYIWKFQEFRQAAYKH